MALAASGSRFPSPCSRSHSSSASDGVVGRPQRYLKLDDCNGTRRQGVSRPAAADRFTSKFSVPGRIARRWRRRGQGRAAPSRS